MKTVTVTLKNRDDVEQEMARKARKLKTAIAAEVQATAHRIVQDAQDHLDDATRQPVSRTGRLAGSLHIVRSADGLMANIKTLLAYGAYLEFGTRRMPAYPWLGPAVDRNRRTFRQAVRAAMRTVGQGRAR